MVLWMVHVVCFCLFMFGVMQNLYFVATACAGQLTLHISRSAPLEAAAVPALLIADGWG